MVQKSCKTEFDKILQAKERACSLFPNNGPLQCGSTAYKIKPKLSDGECKPLGSKNAPFRINVYKTNTGDTKHKEHPYFLKKMGDEEMTSPLNDYLAMVCPV